MALRRLLPWCAAPLALTPCGVSSNRGLSRMYLTRARKLRVPGTRSGDRVRVSVRGMSRQGLLGRPSLARVRR